MKQPWALPSFRHWSAYAQVGFIIALLVKLYLYAVKAPIALILDAGYISVAFGLAWLIGSWRRNSHRGR